MPDPHEYEGSTQDSAGANKSSTPNPNSISLQIHIPPTGSLHLQPPSGGPLEVSLPIPNSEQLGLSMSRLVIKIPRGWPLTPGVCSVSAPSLLDVGEKCTFCPEEYCESIIDKIETHYCTHPLIPGYSHPCAA